MLGTGVGLASRVRRAPLTRSTGPFPELGRFCVVAPSALIMSGDTWEGLLLSLCVLSPAARQEAWKHFAVTAEMTSAMGAPPRALMSVRLCLNQWSLDLPQRCFLHAPLQGIQFLIENDLLQSSPEDVAQFLYKGEGLNKTVIGDYLGER